MRAACQAAVDAARAGRRASPPLPVPGPLRPLLRFARLPEPALAAVRRVLDEDAEFRERVLATLEAAGAPPPLDEASLLFLQRPEGWSASLAALSVAAEDAAAAATDARAEGAASRKLALVQAALDRNQASLEAARLELDSLRRQLGEERRARRVATSELGRFRKRVEELEADRSHPPAGALHENEELATSQTALAAAEEQAAGSGAGPAAPADTGADLPEAEAAEPAEVAEVQPRSVDEAAAAIAAAEEAVGTLTEALGRAADALAGEAVRPAGWPPEGTVASGTDWSRVARLPVTGAARAPARLPPAVFDDTASAADHLLRLPRVLVLVDGYNVTISTRSDLALPAQRRWLLDAAGGVAARTGAELEVVFDGAAGASPHDAGRRLGVHVRFTAPDEEADDVLLDLLEGMPVERPVVVVSDDRRVRDGARRLGANTLGVVPFVGVLRS